MATKEYSDSLRDFCAYYEIDFDPEDLKANKKTLKTLGKENLAPISNNEAANRYFDALTAALTLYTQKSIGVGRVSAYQTFGDERHLNISIHDFIREFELTMQDKFASDLEEGKDTLRDRKPFEGLKFEDVARGAMNRISGKFNKSLANVWASNIVDDKNVIFKDNVIHRHINDRIVVLIGSLDSTVGVNNEGIHVGDVVSYVLLTGVRAYDGGKIGGFKLPCRHKSYIIGNERTEAIYVTVKIRYL
jgi:hypothetical protein